MLYNLLLLFPCFVCLFWAINLFCKWHTNYRAQNVLAINVLLMSIIFFVQANYFAGVTDYEFYYKLDIIDAFVALLIYPSAYLYFKSLTDVRSFNWKDYLWVLPSLLIGGSTAILYGMMGEKDAIAYTQEILNGQELSATYTTLIYKLHFLISVRLYNTLMLLEGGAMIVFSIISLIRYRLRLKDFYSTLEGKSMENNYAVLISFIVLLLFSLSFTYLGRGFFIQYPMLIVPLLMVWASMCFILAYQSSNLKYTADGLAADLARADQEAIEQGYMHHKELDMATAESAVDMDNYVTVKKKIDFELIAQFDSLISEEKVYLQCDLRLDQVARLMHTNRTYISRLINEEYHCSFSDFINCCRIKHAQELMRADNNITQETVALQSGFSHVSSFSRAFKRQTKMTPRKWLMGEK